MTLFDFKLKPLTDIAPWGEEPNLSLHWYGLTDGIYFMNVGKDQLFRYSDEAVEYWKKEYSDFEVFFDYQVARIYEDLLSILPDVLQPIPQCIYEYISTVENQQTWSDKLAQIFDETDNESIEDTYYLASEWLFHRRLQGMGGGPDIMLFRTGEKIHIRWDNESIRIDGFQAWSATRGEYQLTVDEFIDEVHSFHQRLIFDMAERVHTIATNNPFPHVKIDIVNLTKEHEERACSLSTALSNEPHVDNWVSVIEANKKLLGT
ncbi:DUF5984 family protein [Shewanella vesiculosa]|jgi:hypothetical protein|uniref:DUF5984 family protein n=1 Tax=Shewanella vesiculosa TaxID=518738 RepID=A0ABV0FRN0_9GAMM